MYKTAIANAKAAGEASKVRRYDRGLKVRRRRRLILLFVFGLIALSASKKRNASTHLFSVSLVKVLTGGFFSALENQTLQSLLTSAKRGKPINEEEIPPPVAVGGKPSSVPSPESEPVRQREPPQPESISSPPTNQKPLREAPPPNAKPLHLTPPQKPPTAVSPGTPAISPLTPGQPDAQHSGEHPRVWCNGHDVNLVLLSPCAPMCHSSAPFHVPHLTKQNSFYFVLYVSFMSFCPLVLTHKHTLVCLVCLSSM